MNSSPFLYIQRRYENGWYEALQRRLIEPADEEERALRKKLADRWGKYGREVKKVIGRVVPGKKVLYEVAWKEYFAEFSHSFLSFIRILVSSSLSKAYQLRYPFMLCLRCQDTDWSWS